MVQRADINSVLSEIRNMRSQMMENQRVEQDNNIRGRMDGPSKVQETSAPGPPPSEAWVSACSSLARPWVDWVPVSPSATCGHPWGEKTEGTAHSALTRVAGQMSNRRMWRSRDRVARFRVRKSVFHRPHCACASVAPMSTMPPGEVQ